METKHVLEFETKAGVLTVGTNDLDELSQQSWFREFLGESVSRQEQVRETVQGNAYRKSEEYVQRLERNMEKAERVIDDMQERIMELESQNKPRQNQPQQAPQQVPQRQEQRQQQVAQGNPVRRDAYLEITPNNMTEEQWKTLNPQQQEEYYRKYYSNR